MSKLNVVGVSTILFLLGLVMGSAVFGPSAKAGEGVGFSIITNNFHMQYADCDVTPIKLASIKYGFNVRCYKEGTRFSGQTP